MDLRCVSLHAVTRYCQRVLGVTVPWAEPPLTATEIAAAHCAAANTDIETVRQAILRPAVALAISAGGTRARLDGFEVLIKRGVVSTVISVGSKYRPRRVKNLTRREIRHHSHQHARKKRRKFPTAGGGE